MEGRDHSEPLTKSTLKILGNGDHPKSIVAPQLDPGRLELKDLEGFYQNNEFLAILCCFAHLDYLKQLVCDEEFQHRRTRITADAFLDLVNSAILMFYSEECDLRPCFEAICAEVRKKKLFLRTYKQKDPIDIFLSNTQEAILSLFSLQEQEEFQPFLGGLYSHFAFAGSINLYNHVYRAFLGLQYHPLIYEVFVDSRHSFKVLLQSPSCHTNYTVGKLQEQIAACTEEYRDSLWIDPTTGKEIESSKCLDNFANGGKFYISYLLSNMYDYRTIATICFTFRSSEDCFFLLTLDRSIYPKEQLSRAIMQRVREMLRPKRAIEPSDIWVWDAEGESTTRYNLEAFLNLLYQRRHQVLDKMISLWFDFEHLAAEVQLVEPVSRLIECKPSTDQVFEDFYHSKDMLLEPAAASAKVIIVQYHPNIGLDNDCLQGPLTSKYLTQDQTVEFRLRSIVARHLLLGKEVYTPLLRKNTVDGVAWFDPVRNTLIRSLLKCPGLVYFVFEREYKEIKNY